MSAIIILIYSVICRFLTSLYSIRFNKVLMEVDGACFYDIGKAIVDGKILYKEVFDHKAPYIYFINALGSLIDYNHFGLFIIEKERAASLPLIVNYMIPSTVRMTPNASRAKMM